jgi:flavin-dependent dehydrogenase
METATVAVVDLRPAEAADAAAEVAHASANVGEVAGLTEREQDILRFERKWWRYAGGKEQALMDMFQLSSTRYFQVLNALIDQPAALAFDPMLVKRLRRMRHTRQQARSTARRAHG